MTTFCTTESTTESNSLTLCQELVQAWEAFEAAGGRGVELADRIDHLIDTLGAQGVDGVRGAREFIRKRSDADKKTLQACRQVTEAETAPIHPCFEELNDIARAIQPHEAAWRAAWEQLLAPDSRVGEIEKLREATAALNREVELRIPDVARVTGNNVDALRCGLRPADDLSCWFGCSPLRPPSEFLRNVARYRSFNERYWAEAQRRQEREGFSLRAQRAPAVDAGTAARQIAAGGIPTVRSEDVMRSLPAAASRLERHLFALGVLDSYHEGDVAWRARRRVCAASEAEVERRLGGLPDRLFAAQSFAYLVEEASAPARLVYWPAGWARNHCVEQDHLEAAQDLQVDRDDSPAWEAPPRG